MNVVKPSLAAILAALATLGHANLLLNGNFESVPNNSTGPGLLPLWSQSRS